MSLLPVHIIAGSIAIISGFVSVFAIKGLKLHRKSGMLFVYSMLVLALTGAAIATLKHQPASIIGGLLAFYLVTTAFLAVRPRDYWFRLIHVAAFAFGASVSAFAFKIGFDALQSATGTSQGVPAGMLFFFATIALLGALGDARMLVTGGLQGPQRIARHLWRMCFSLFIASGSFFLGQAKVIPKPIRILPLLAIPALLPLVLLLYWLARVLFTRWYRSRAALDRESAVASGSPASA
jgi:uncharacterized membrane protein